MCSMSRSIERTMITVQYNEDQQILSQDKVQVEMSGVMCGEDMTVVKRGGAKRFELDVEALQRMLLRDDVRHLPVVVVSVAGDNRGGKSFLLNYFLRYLYAPRSCQLNGEWLGKDDQPLEGFHWRGGGERDTTGIHMWSEPIITTLASGGKVVVLLMDTQGTFDAESTIGENSTGFALSTLFSSVQIYNMSGNIKEYNLQHLQLFTEYGRLASDPGEKAFQTLLFLIRDWQYNWDHAYGFEGGKELLEKRLQFPTSLKKEIHEVREHIRSSFSNIECFLMPHPGLSVAKRDFNGCIHDLTNDFKRGLLTLIPKLFDPSHLTPKLINGEPVKAQDLLEYFKNYVDIFNTHDMPEPTTIFKATSQACLTLAVADGRALYESRMHGKIRVKMSVPRRVLQAWHDAALAATVNSFISKKKLGSPADTHIHLEQLKNVVNGMYSVFTFSNDTQLRKTLSSTQKTYEKVLSSGCALNARLCLHPLDLKDLHYQACAAAHALFRSERYLPDDQEDEDWVTFEQSLNKRYEQLNAINEHNNKNAVLKAVDLYVTQMKRELEHGAVSSERLHAEHQAALDAALALFNEKRNRATTRKDDPYVNILREEINSIFPDFEQKNIKSNRIAMQVAELTYNNYMMDAWGPQWCCLHPTALQELHKKAKPEALLQFQTHRAECNEQDEQKLMTVLDGRYSELVTINEHNNSQAVEQAFLRYKRKMDKYVQPTLAYILVIPKFVNVFVNMPKHHAVEKPIAITMFYNCRRGLRFDPDPYYDCLVEKIEEAYKDYGSLLYTIKLEFGIPNKK